MRTIAENATATIHFKKNSLPDEGETSDDSIRSILLSAYFSVRVFVSSNCLSEESPSFEMSESCILFFPVVKSVPVV